MANTVGSVGRKTGVEESLRRYLGRRTSDMVDSDVASRGDVQGRAGHAEHNPKHNTYADRQAHENGIMKLSSNISVDTLPMYDDNKSPAYEEELSPAQSRSTDIARRHPRPPILRSWSAQLMISTSGLGVALSDGSLRSLKYCLGTLRNANKHVWNLMEALKRLLQDYDRSSRQVEGSGRGSGDEVMSDGALLDDPAMVAQRIQRLTDEIWQTVQKVVTTVSSYTGGALPENASAVVRWQLMSVPRRWARAVSRSSQSDDAVSGAHRMLAFATEGLDMIEQVGGVVDKTIQSAERWLDSMGRKREEDEDEAEGEDSKMDVEVSEAADGVEAEMQDA